MPPSRLIVSAVIVCFGGLAGGVAAAQVLPPVIPTQVTQIAAAGTGVITGTVLDEAGKPLDGVVISAMGGSTSFAVSDRTGQFTLRSLMPGPYLVRAHLDGYMPARGTMLNVRPAGRTASNFTMRRAGRPGEPRVTAASVGGAEASTAPDSTAGRSESETAWRLRHLKRSVLKDSAALAEIPAETDSWFITDSFGLLGRAVESSARLAGDFFVHSPFEGQVNLLTTGTFNAPGELLQLERTRGVAYFAVGAAVGDHADWTVKAALNQGDLSSWLLTGSYVTRAPAAHQYQFGMSYGLHRYEGGNAAAMTAMPEGARNVGSLYGNDAWTISRHLTVTYGAHYAHYDYLLDPAHLSPRVGVTVRATDNIRIRGVAARQVTAPGAEEFLPPTGAQVLPPQRTFAPLSRTGFLPEELQHYELGVERLFDGFTVGVRGFEQRVDEQLVTLFGLSMSEGPAADVGHYFVGSAGAVDVHGWGINVAHALMPNVQGSFDYSLADAEWTNARSVDRLRLARYVPSALRPSNERIHDFTTTLETQVPQSATRVYVLYKLNSGYIRADGSESQPGLDGRWDVQVSQGLPFLNFMRAEWEMLIGVRNVFRDSFNETSIYDELLVARPPKRLVGGITVKF
jgi:outer membrane receptor protein involved in Fe transport